MISMTSLVSTWIWDIIMRPHVAVVFELMRHAGSIPRYSKTLTRLTAFVPGDVSKSLQ